MLFSGNLSNDIFGGLISTYFVYAAVLHLLWVLGGSYWAKMGCCNGHGHGTKKVENHWFSAIHKDKNSHSGPHTEQTLREKVHIWLGSLHAANFIYCLCDDSLFVYQKILCVYVLEKVKTILHCFSHSPTIVEKYFCWKWTHFRKIYQWRLSFFWSWRHFLDTSRLIKILEGTLVEGAAEVVRGEQDAQFIMLSMLC